MPLREKSRHRLKLTLAMVAILGGFVSLAFATTALWANTAMNPEIAPAINWMSWTGIIALLGLAVQWGKVQERGDRFSEAIRELKKQHDTFVTNPALQQLEERMDGRLDRLEKNLDSFRNLLQVERRHYRRGHPTDEEE